MYFVPTVLTTSNYTKFPGFLSCISKFPRLGFFQLQNVDYFQSDALGLAF